MCKTKVFSLKSEVKKAYLHAHKRILIMPSIMKEVCIKESKNCVDPQTYYKGILQRESTDLHKLGGHESCVCLAGILCIINILSFVTKKYI